MVDFLVARLIGRWWPLGNERANSTFTVFRVTSVCAFTISCARYILFLVEILIFYREMALNTKDSSLLRGTDNDPIRLPSEDKSQSQTVLHMIIKFLVP